MVEELGLKNIKFLQEDVIKLSREDHGQFDYIAAHGLFSWVPDFVREKVLGNLFGDAHAARHRLFKLQHTSGRIYAADVAGYDALSHAGRAAFAEKVEKGISILSFLKDSTKSDPYYNEILKNEIGFVTNHSPTSIFHDELGELNQPFYFHEFAKLAEAHNLQYLSEAEYYTDASASISAASRRNARLFRRRHYPPRAIYRFPALQTFSPDACVPFGR